MTVYLPIAEMPVNILLILAMGAGVGMLSGIFGVGGGFLMTPLLMFIGIPAPVAVASEANQIAGASVSGALAHWRRGNVDVWMGALLVAGGLAGAVAGVWLFAWLRAAGQIELAIRLAYVAFLGVIGVLMVVEGARAMRRVHRRAPPRKLHQHMWIHGLPLKMRFRRSRLYISVIPPLAVGFIVGVLSAVMGVGGGFIIVPAMIYLLGMPTAVVVGTSLFQIVFVTAAATFLQAWVNQTVDVVLAFLLLVGGVLGAQIGARVGARLRAEYLRALLGGLVLLVCGGLALELVIPPADLYAVTPLPQARP